MEDSLDESLRKAFNDLEPPGSNAAEFHSTAGWMKAPVI